MKHKIACRECPFRIESSSTYDEDALEALDEGYIPCCHAIVGANAIFSNDFPEEKNVCAGYNL